MYFKGDYFDLVIILLGFLIYCIVYFYLFDYYIVIIGLIGYE